MTSLAETGAAAPGPGSALPHWQTIRREPHADCRVFSVVRKWCRHPQRDVTHDFFVIDSPDWVNVVALTTDNELVLVNQFRFGTEEISLEVPGGIIDAGEDPIAAGRRELLEETGFGGGVARVMGTIRPNPAVQNNTCHLVLLEGVNRTAELAWDEHEEIEAVHLGVEEVFRLARSGGIRHALTLNALFLFEPYWQNRERQSQPPAPDARLG